VDVGTIVENSGLLAALFALLACVALAVELGRRPPKPKQMFVSDDELSESDKTSKTEDKTQTAPVESTGPAKPSLEIPSRGFGSPVLQPAPAAVSAIPEVPFDQVQPTIANASDFAAERKASLAHDNLLILQRTYVDGFLSSRGKYDVALAILNEYRVSSTIAASTNVGQTMATEAYLSATRTGAIEGDRAPFLAGLMKSIISQPAETIADDIKQNPFDPKAKSKSEKNKSEQSKPSGKVEESPSSSPRTSNTTERRRPPSSRSRNRNTRD
jgi:hypothetical protein